MTERNESSVGVSSTSQTDLPSEPIDSGEKTIGHENSRFDWAGVPSEPVGPPGLTPHFSLRGSREVFRLWAPLLLKGAGGSILLVLIACLGRFSQNETNYGSFASELTEVASSQQSPDPADSARQEKGKRAEPEPTHAAARGETPGCPEVEESGPSGLTPDGRVILNEASAEEMTRLPGVGKSRAESILKLRARLGKFKKLSDLLRVRGIGWRTLKKLKEKAVVDRPPETSEPETKPKTKIKANANRTVLDSAVQTRGKAT